MLVQPVEQSPVLEGVVGHVHGAHTLPRAGDVVAVEPVGIIEPAVRQRIWRKNERWIVIPAQPVVLRPDPVAGRVLGGPVPLAHMGEGGRELQHDGLILEGFAVEARDVVHDADPQSTRVGPRQIGGDGSLDAVVVCIGRGLRLAVDAGAGLYPFQAGVVVVLGAERPDEVLIFPQEDGIPVSRHVPGALEPAGAGLRVDPLRHATAAPFHDVDADAGRQPEIPGFGDEVVYLGPVVRPFRRLQLIPEEEPVGSGPRAGRLGVVPGVQARVIVHDVDAGIPDQVLGILGVGDRAEWQFVGPEDRHVRGRRRIRDGCLRRQHGRRNRRQGDDDYQHDAGNDKMNTGTVTNETTHRRVSWRSFLCRRQRLCGAQTIAVSMTSGQNGRSLTCSVCRMSGISLCIVFR